VSCASHFCFLSYFILSNVILQVLSGNLFNILFGRNLDNHAAKPQPTISPPTHALTAHTRGLPSSSELQCYDGNVCYVDRLVGTRHSETNVKYSALSIRMSLLACFCALALSVFAAWRDKHRLDSTHPKSTVLWTVEEESSNNP
jgi:hypothetical protein